MPNYLQAQEDIAAKGLTDPAAIVAWANEDIITYVGAWTYAGLRMKYGREAADGVMAALEKDDPNAAKTLTGTGLMFEESLPELVKEYYVNNRRKRFVDWGYESFGEKDLADLPAWIKWQSLADDTDRYIYAIDNAGDVIGELTGIDVQAARETLVAKVQETRQKLEKAEAVTVPDSAKDVIVPKEPIDEEPIGEVKP